MKKYSFPKEKIKIYLFEKIDQAAKETFEEAGYIVECIPDSRQGADLDKILEDAHIIGVRSRSKVTAENLAKAKRLLAIGCYSVGTDMVDLEAARKNGVAVFNAPHSSTRSVAELTVGAVISLARRLAHNSAKMHDGVWQKSSAGAYEIRGKSIGIIGYGHIGQQAGLLAEALGMNVVFYDIVKKLILGRAKTVNPLKDLLSTCDYVSMHVPSTPETKDMIGRKELDFMKKGSYFINYSRGNTVDISALAQKLKSGDIAGAAVDVFPVEPKSNDAKFESELQGLDNVILSPHIGGSTVEAQRNIGKEVAYSLTKFLENGSTEGAVKFPQVNLPSIPGSYRILNIHQNKPGVLSNVNNIISKIGANIQGQYLSTYEDVGYLIMDLDKGLAEEVQQKIAELPESLKTRILY